MRPRLLLSAATFLLLGSSIPWRPAAASWAVKKLVGNQWRNGNRIIAQALGRGHSEIKGLIASLPPSYQDQYRQLAEHYADSAEARAKTSNPATVAALDEHMRYLKEQAELLLAGVLGPSVTQRPRTQQEGTTAQPRRAGGADYTAGAGGVGDALLDPLQEQMLNLQQRQQQQMQQLIQQMQQSQQEERIRVEQQLRKARELHLAIQGESNKIRSSLVGIQGGLQDVRSRIVELSRAEDLIERLTARLETALQRVSTAEADGGAPISDPQELQALDGSIYIQTKARLGRLLADINTALQYLNQQIGEAETRASDLADMGPSGKQLSEQLLQGCASFRVALASQEEYLREVVSILEAKQIHCDATFDRLKAALDAAFARYSGALKGRAVELQQEIVSTGEGLRAAAATGAEQLRAQIEREIQKYTVSGISSPSAAAQQLQMLQHYAATWSNNVDQSLVSFDGVLETGQKLVAAARSLPPAHAADVSTVQQALQRANETKRYIRQERARVQHLLRILETHYKEGLQQQQQQQLQTQAGSSLGAPADPFARYSLPTQLPQQQQQTQGAHQFGGIGVGAPLPTGMGAPQMVMGAPQMVMGAPQMVMGAPQMTIEGSAARPELANMTTAGGVGAPQMGMGAPHMGMGAPQMGMEAPPMDMGAPEMISLADAEMSRAGAEMVSLADADMSMDGLQMNMGGLQMGMGAPEMSEEVAPPSNDN